MLTLKKKSQPRIQFLKYLIQFNAEGQHCYGRRNIFSGKQKLRELITTKSALHKKCQRELFESKSILINIIKTLKGNIKLTTNEKYVVKFRFCDRIMLVHNLFIIGLSVK